MEVRLPNDGRLRKLTPLPPDAEAGDNSDGEAYDPGGEMEPR